MKRKNLVTLVKVVLTAYLSMWIAWTQWIFSAVFYNTWNISEWDIELVCMLIILWFGATSFLAGLMYKTKID